MKYDKIRKAAAIAFKKDKGFYKATTEIGEYSIMDVCEDAHNHAFMLGVEWANEQPQWISVKDQLPPRSELNENISDAVITFGYYDDGLHFLVELNRYHYKDGKWLYSQAKYWMPFQHPKKGGEE